MINEFDKLFDASLLPNLQNTQEEINLDISNLKQQLGISVNYPSSDVALSEPLMQLKSDALARINDLRRTPNQKMYRDLYINMAEAQFDVVPYLEGLDKETLSYIVTQILNDVYYAFGNVKMRTGENQGDLLQDESEEQHDELANTGFALNSNSLRNAQSILAELQQISDPKLIDILTRIGLNCRKIEGGYSQKYGPELTQIVRFGMSLVDGQDQQIRESMIDSAIQEIQNFYQFFDFDNLSGAAEEFGELIGTYFEFSDSETSALFVKSFALHIQLSESVFTSKLNSFIKFCDDRKVPLSQINADLTTESRNEILQYLYRIATSSVSINIENMPNNVARIVDAVTFDQTLLEKQIEEFPVGFTFGELIEHFSSGQQGIYFVKNLHFLMLYGEWNYRRDIMPIIESQGPGAFIYVSAMNDYYSNKFGVLDDDYDEVSQKYTIDKDEQIELVRIAKKYGTEATNVLRELVNSEDTLTRAEADNLDEFLNEIGIASRGLYVNYRGFKQSGNEQAIANLKLEVDTLVSAIASGNLAEIDFHHRLFYPTNYYVFPPAIGVQKDHYQKIIDRRPDRNSDVPVEIEQLQYLQIDLPMGEYALENGDSLDLNMWDDIRRIVNQIGKENPPRKIDSITVARKLIAQYTENKNPSRIERRRIIEDLYRLHLSSGGMPLPNSFDLTVEGLMQYKEFIGVRLQRELTRSCLEELRLHNPAEYKLFEKFIQNRIRSNGEKSFGVYLSLSKEIKRTEGQNKEKATERLAAFLSKFDLTLDSIKKLSKEELVQIFSQVSSAKSPFDMVVEECEGLIKSTNQEMLQEIGKFDFFPNTTVIEKTRRIEFFISKKQEHGAAGLNMGVCTAIDDDLWEDPDFWNCIILDSSSNRAMGGMHILISGEDLILPGINPSMELIASLGAATVLDEMIAYAHEIKKCLGLSRLIIPTNKSIHSNRDQIGELIEKYGKKQDKVKYINPIEFSTKPFTYSINEGYIVPEKTGTSVSAKLALQQKEVVQADVLNFMNRAFGNKYPQIYRDWSNQEESATSSKYQSPSGRLEVSEAAQRHSDQIDRIEFLTPIQQAILNVMEKHQAKN